MHEYGDFLVGFVTFLLFIATIACVVVASRLGKQQEALQRELAAKNEELQDQIAHEAGERQRSQRLFEQRAQLLPLWQYISSLSDIDPKEPVTPDIVKAVNTLELIALCVEAQIVDSDVIMRTLRDRFIDIYDKIAAFGPLPGYRGDHTGGMMLADCRAASLLMRSSRPAPYA